MADLEIRVERAEGLKDVKKIGTMHAYAVAWVQKPGASFSADQNAIKVMTRPDKQGGCNPLWNELVTLPVSADLAELHKSFIIFHIYTASMIMPDDTQVGSAVVPFADILRQVDHSGRPICMNGAPQPVTVAVQRPSLRYKGTLSFSLRLLIPGPLATSSASASAGGRLPESLLRNTANPETATFHSSAPTSAGPAGPATAAVAAMMLL
ncbi:hypothetical protein L7F22_058121 [Adiantum nelumboides]|nr:hypothetical protein [Adiantum nelumboides]